MRIVLVCSEGLNNSAGSEQLGETKKNVLRGKDSPLRRLPMMFEGNADCDHGPLFVMPLNGCEHC